MASSTTSPGQSHLADILAKDEGEILGTWLSEQLTSVSRRSDLISDAELRQQSKTLLAEIAAAVRAGGLKRLDGPEWAAARVFLTEISRSRAAQGFTPAETAHFVFSLRGALLDRLQTSFGNVAGDSAAEMRATMVLIDTLGLLTADEAINARDEVMRRQQEEMLELSTPVVRLFPGILGLPLIGTLDSARTQIVMENLLQRIVETESTIAIIDITGVPTVDTLVAQHLLKTVAATRLMGADCIISGMRPQIAQTIVHLGVELQNVATKATLADALMLALQKLGLSVQKNTRSTAKES